MLWVKRKFGSNHKTSFKNNYYFKLQFLVCQLVTCDLMLNVLHMKQNVKIVFCQYFQSNSNFFYSMLSMCLENWNRKCPICQKPLGDQEEVVLRDKGRVEKNAQSLQIVSGTLLHTECPRKYQAREERCSSKGRFWKGTN